PHGTEGLFYLVEAVQDVGQFPVKWRDAVKLGKPPYDIDKAVVDRRTNRTDKLLVRPLLVDLLLHLLCRTAETPVQDLIGSRDRRHFFEFHKSPTYIFMECHTVYRYGPVPDPEGYPHHPHHPLPPAIAFHQRGKYCRDDPAQPRDGAQPDAGPESHRARGRRTGPERGIHTDGPCLRGTQPERFRRRL